MQPYRTSMAWSDEEPGRAEAERRRHAKRTLFGIPIGLVAALGVAMLAGELASRTALSRPIQSTGDPPATGAPLAAPSTPRILPVTAVGLEAPDPERLSWGGWVEVRGSRFGETPPRARVVMGPEADPAEGAR